MATDLTGLTFGSYKLLELLGRGGMASVYRGYQESIDRSVAIKVLPHEFLHDPNFSQRFVAEARTLAKLTHPAILPLYDFGTANEVPYIVMPLMAGGTLADRIKGGPMSLAETVRILTPIADALDFAHSQNVIHRDIKPSNILFDQRGQPFLADFGIAKALEASTHLTGTAIVGTPDYMSPEQARGEQLDGRSDMYSLGVMAFQCLTGDTLFKATTPIGVMLKHATELPPPIRQVRRDVPQAVEEVLLKALAKHPQDRYQSAKEFMKAFSAAVSGMPIPVSQTSPATLLEQVPTLKQTAYVSAAPSRPVDSPTAPPPLKAPTVPGVPSAQAPAPAAKKGGIGGILIGGSLGVILGVGFGVLLLIACCIGLYALGASVTPTPSPAPTATPEPTVSPYLFYDDFSDPGSGWEVSTDDVANIGYTDGQYFIQAFETGWFIWGNPRSASYKNASIEMKVKKISGDYKGILYGVMCNFQDNQHYYYFGIDSDGYYAISKRDGEDDTILTGGGKLNYSSKLAQGDNWFRITAECANGKQTLYVDSVLIDSAADTEYAEGNMGLFAYVYSPDTGNANQKVSLEFRYDDVVITALP